MLKALSRFHGNPSLAVIFNSISTLMIKIASAGLIYAMFVLIARVTTVAEFGKFGVGFNLASFLAIIASCGVHVGINRWWPEYLAKSQPRLASASFFWGLRVTSIASAGLAIATVALNGTFTVISGAVDYYLVAAGALLVPLALADYLANALRSQGSIWWAQLPRDVLWRLMGCGMAIYVALNSGKLTASAALWMLALSLALLITIQLVIAVRTARSVVVADRSSFDFGGERARWVATTRPLWGGALLAAMVQYIDVLLVGAFVSIEKSAEYFAAVRTVNIIGLMHVAATLVCAPLISRTVHSNQLAELQHIFKVVAALVGGSTLLILLMLVVLGPFLLGLFGPAFDGGYPLLIILAVGFGFNALCGPVGYLLMVAGHERAFLKILIFSNSVGLALQCSLIPFIGALGAAIGSSVALIISGVWARQVAITKLGLDPTVLSLFLNKKSQER